MKSGRINNRLLCEIATHERFIKLLADAEIYVDGIATMRIRDLNSSLEAARVMILEENPEAAADRYLQTLEAGQIEEEDFFCHITHKSWAVSYTYLDVYKRQLFALAVAIISDISIIQKPCSLR